MFMRLKLSLPSTEYDALSKLAVCELRNPHDQIRHILRQELERRRLLPANAPAIKSDAAQPLAAEAMGGQNAPAS